MATLASRFSCAGEYPPAKSDARLSRSTRAPLKSIGKSKFRIPSQKAWELASFFLNVRTSERWIFGLEGECPKWVSFATNGTVGERQGSATERPRRYSSYPLHLLRQCSIQLRHKVRLRHRMAKCLGADRERKCSNRRGRKLGNDSDESLVYRMRSAPGSCL